MLLKPYHDHTDKKASSSSCLCFARQSETPVAPPSLSDPPHPTAIGPCSEALRGAGLMLQLIALLSSEVALALLYYAGTQAS
jgi:hypothetical protein